MKNFVTMAFLMMASMSAYAASTPRNEQEQNGIVTRDVATNMWRTYAIEYDDDLNILICPRNMEFSYKNPYNTCSNPQGKSAWVKMEKVVPKGKTFVGFKSVTQNGSHYIEIYWK